MDYEHINSVAIAVIWHNDSEPFITDYCPFCGERHPYSDEDGWTEVWCFDQPLFKNQLSFPKLETRTTVEGIVLKQSDGYIVRTRKILNPHHDSIPESTCVRLKLAAGDE